MQLFEKLYQQLNTEQRSAVDHIEGPVLTVAGPGTGKTQILALRIANILVKTQVSPSNILAITFTDSGAVAVKNRLKQVLGARMAYQVNVHTFHSLCTRIISENQEIFSYKKELALLDTIGSYEIIREILTDGDFQHLVSVHNRFYLVNDIVSCISTLKKEGITPDRLGAFAESGAAEIQQKIDAGEKLKSDEYRGLQKFLKLRELADLYESYLSVLRERDFFDYDDTILFVLKAFREHPELLLMYQERFQYFLVDEFQDTNNSQNQLVMTLASFFESPNLFVVGDDDQSIYRFQGASVENIVSFKNSFSDLKEVVLRENYRSGQLILDVAKSVIDNNEERIVPDKTISAANPIEADISVCSFSDSDQEGYFIASKIKELVDAGVNPEEIAVLVRKNSDIHSFISYFDQLKVPYFLHAGKRLMDEKIIELIIDVFEFALTPKDDFLLFKILSHEKFRFNDSDLFKIYHSVAKLEDQSILSLTRDDLERLNLLELDKFTITLDKLKSVSIRMTRETAVNAFRGALHDTGLLDSIMNSPDYLEQLVYVNSFFTQIRKFHGSNPKLTLKELVEKFRLMKEHRVSLPVEIYTLGKVGVQIMTAHKSKGLEFEYVFVPVCTDGNWSNSRSYSTLSIPFELVYSHEVTQSPIEEERRLFYVALTRAKSSIFVSYAQNYKARATQSMPSEFIDEISGNLIVKLEPEVDPARLLVTTLEVGTGHDSERWTDMFKDLISNYVQNSFRLSPTSLNNYLNCKRTFLYHDILKVPSPKSLNLFLGSAVHEVLETQYRPGLTLDVDKLDRVIQKILDKATLTESDINLVKVNALDILKNWLEKNPNVPELLHSEYNFGFKNIHIKDVPVTGKIDRIDILSKEDKTVKLIDYKVSRPKTENQILGKTKNSNKNYLYQLLFYCSLCLNDPTFHFAPEQAELVFLRPDGSSGKYVNRSFSFTKEEINDFENMLQEIYNEITTLKFLEQLDDPCECEECLYANY